MCKMMFIRTFFFVVYLHSTSAIKCLSCIGIIIDRTNASLPANKSYCETTDESAALCRSEMRIDFIDTYRATVDYIFAPSNILITATGDSELVTTITIPLDITDPYGSIVYNCYDKDLCNEKIIQKQYEQLLVLNSSKLVTELTDLLYDNTSILQRNQVECYNRNNDVERCVIDGSCQATLIIEQGQSDSLITNCIPNRRPGSISGVVLHSTSVGNDYKKTVISYTCNKNECNDPETVEKVREILVKIDLVNSKANNLKFISIVLFIMCTVTNMWTH